MAKEGLDGKATLGQDVKCGSAQYPLSAQPTLVFRTPGTPSSVLFLVSLCLGCFLLQTSVFVGVLVNLPYAPGGTWRAGTEVWHTAGMLSMTVSFPWPVPVLSQLS